MENNMFRGSFEPYVSPFDPCPPIKVKTFVLPPQLFMDVQPPGLPQYTPAEALRQGSLWPALVDGFSKREGIF